MAQHLSTPTCIAIGAQTCSSLQHTASMQDTTFQNPPAAIATLEDERSGAIPFTHYPAAEQALAAQATFLLAAADVGPRATPAEAQELLSLLTKADESVSAAPYATSSSLLTGLFPLCAFCVVTSAPWSTDQRPADDAGFKALAQSKELAAAVAALKDTGTGFAAVARLAYGVAMAVLHDSVDGFDDGKGSTALVAAAIDAGALQHLVRNPLPPPASPLLSLYRAASATDIVLGTLYSCVIQTSRPEPELAHSRRAYGLRQRLESGGLAPANALRTTSRGFTIRSAPILYLGPCGFPSSPCRVSILPD